MFVHLINRTKFLVRVRSFIKRTNVNELLVERFTNCSLNVRFVYSPRVNNLEIYIDATSVRKLNQWRTQEFSMGVQNILKSFRRLDI
ncbi:hypothetical protein Hanom_Chr13g01234331 [Helianthus anomalus]